MVSCFEYLVSLIGSFIATLDGLTVIAGFSLLDLIIALIIITLLIVLLFARRFLIFVFFLK